MTYHTQKGFSVPKITPTYSEGFAITLHGKTWLARAGELLDTLKISFQADAMRSYGQMLRRFSVDMTFRAHGSDIHLNWRGLSRRRALKLQALIVEQLRPPHVALQPAPKTSLLSSLFKSALLISAGALAACGMLLYGANTTPEQPESEERVSMETLNNLKAIAMQAGIPMLSGREYSETPSPFYVLSRPDCEACSPADLALPHLSTEFLPIIIPTGFEDSPRSVYAVSDVYCSEKPDVRWMDFASGAALPESPANCDWNERATLAAMTAALTEIGVPGDTRPVIIAPNGVVFRGTVDVADPVSGLNQWLTDNKGGQ